MLFVSSFFFPSPQNHFHRSSPLTKKKTTAFLINSIFRFYRYSITGGRSNVLTGRNVLCKQRFDLRWNICCLEPWYVISKIIDVARPFDFGEGSGKVEETSQYGLCHVQQKRVKDGHRFTRMRETFLFLSFSFSFLFLLFEIMKA